jgi:hypothetical protein
MRRIPVLLRLSYPAFNSTRFGPGRKCCLQSAMGGYVSLRPILQRSQKQRRHVGVGGMVTIAMELPE